MKLQREARFRVDQIEKLAGDVDQPEAVRAIHSHPLQYGTGRPIMGPTAAFPLHDRSYGDFVMNIRFNRSTILLTLLGSLLLLCLPRTASAQFPFDECSNSEAWTPVGAGLADGAVHAVVWNGELYALHNRYDTTVTLSKWDGAAWIDITTMHLSRSKARGYRVVISDLVVHGGLLYVTGIFDAVDGLPETSGLAVWDGVNWKGVPGNPLRNGLTWILDSYQTESFKMTSYKGELIVAGTIDKGGNPQEAVVAWNGSAWRTIAQANDSNDSLYVTAFAEWHGDLYVGGYFSRIGGVGAHGIAKWDGTAWGTVGGRNMVPVANIFIYHDQLHLLCGTEIGFNPAKDATIQRWDGAEWRPMAGTSKLVNGDFRALGAAVYDDKVYLIGARDYFSNGMHTIPAALVWDGGSGVRNLARPDSLAHFLIEYKGGLYAGGEFTGSCNENLNYVAKLCSDADCIGMSGRVMESTSDDCAADPGKPGLEGRIIEITPGPHYAITESDGGYRRYAEPGTYGIHLVPKPYWNQTCPDVQGDRSAVLMTPGDPSKGNNFAAEPMPGIRDIGISVTGGIARPGQAISYTITCTNHGTVPIEKCTIHFDPDSWLTYDGSQPKADRVAGKLVWEADDIGVGESVGIQVWGTVSRDLLLGMTVCASASADVDGDVNPADNRQTECIPVIASHDPNDIAVAPVGTGEAGNITPRDSVLTYTIRFQNNGNDTAQRVVVIDTLSRNLDLTSFTLGATSHPFTLHIGDRGELIWDFQNINLPDSAHENLRSQGYLKYSVRLRRGLPANTRIENRAGIYFDYNTPVLTNTVLSTLTVLSGVDEPAAASALILYPNPARGVVHLRGEMRKGGTVEIANAAGAIVRSLRYNGDGDMRIDLEGLAAGAYTITAELSQGRGTGRITLVK
ncbi:MAG: gliding motility-related protein [Chlorobi bacterium]|nr:gliding motility-related protein [Chlorobiota bacterium]